MLRYFWPSDDEQLAGQWTDSHFDEDGSWWASVQKSGSTLALATALALAATSTAAASSVFSQAQDDPAGSLNVQVLVQEDYWQNPVYPTVWPQSSVLTDDDVHPTFVSIFAADDGDYWHQLVAPVVDANRVSLPFLDPEEIPVGSFPTTTPVLEEGLWTPQVPPADLDWNVLFFLDDGSWVPAMEPDEDNWQPQIQPQNWPQPAQAFSADDGDGFVNAFVADEQYWQNWAALDLAPLRLLQPFLFEQNESPTLQAFTNEDYWPNPVAPVPASIWLLRQDAFEQTDATGGLTSGLEEGVNPTLVAPLQATLLPLWPFLFDQVESPTFVPFTDEIFWANPTLPVAASNWVLRQDAFDQQEPSGSLFLDLDEGLWLNNVAPVPDGLRLLQQWPFDQLEAAGSLYVIPNEEYWLNPVAPLNWPQPSVLTADESIEQFVAAFRADEDLWLQLVQPLPSSNFVAPFTSLSGNREEETPLLTPAIPPLPPVPCLPPAGPDGDLHFSYFGGSHPTAVLLCRICNSGRPLLVRGDYAIWCQDCCAFVTKSDTYMGTVRAPGRFKGVF